MLVAQKSSFLGKFCRVCDASEGKARLKLKHSGVYLHLILIIHIGYETLDPGNFLVGPKETRRSKSRSCGSFLVGQLKNPRNRLGALLKK